MASDRMMQAIGRIEQALTRIERVASASGSPESGAFPARHDVADALKSLDALIAELKEGAAHG